MPTYLAKFTGPDGKLKEEEFIAFSDEDAIKFAQKFEHAVLEQKGRFVVRLPK